MTSTGFPFIPAVLNLNGELTMNLWIMSLLLDWHRPNVTLIYFAETLCASFSFDKILRVNA